MKWASIYGTYIQGLEETPAATSGTDNELEVFPPTTSTQWEAGLKLEPRENLLAQFAWFKIDRGAAYAANLPGTNTLHYFTDGREEYQGVEFSLSGYVMPDLAINATATALTAERACSSAGNGAVLAQAASSPTAMRLVHRAVVRWINRCMVWCPSKVKSGPRCGRRGQERSALSGGTGG